MPNKCFDFKRNEYSEFNITNEKESNTYISDSDLSEQYMADVRIHLKENGVGGIQEYLRKKLEGSKDVKIRFAITGNSGTGKSAFTNAIRG